MLKKSSNKRTITKTMVRKQSNSCFSSPQLSNPSPPPQPPAAACNCNDVAEFTCTLCLNYYVYVVHFLSFVVVLKTPYKIVKRLTGRVKIRPVLDWRKRFCLEIILRFQTWMQNLRISLLVMPRRRACFCPRIEY